MEVRFRSALSEDVDDLVRLDREQGGRGTRRSGWQRTLAKTGGDVLIAEIVDRRRFETPIGFLRWDRDRTDANVRQMVVGSRWRNLGIGERMGQRALLDMIRVGVARAGVDAEPDSPGGRLFSTFGFAGRPGDPMSRNLATFPSDVAASTHFRLALPGDADELGRLMHVVRGPERLTRQIPLRYASDGLRTSIRDGQRNIVIGVSRGNVVSAAEWSVDASRRDGEEAWVNTMGVDPAVQRYGLGRRTTEQMFRYSATDGVGTLKLTAMADSSSFWRKVGFWKGPTLMSRDVSSYDESRDLQGMREVLGYSHGMADHSRPKVAAATVRGLLDRSAEDVAASHAVDPTLTQDQLVRSVPGVILHLDNTGNHKQARDLAVALAQFPDATDTNWFATEEAVARTVNSLDARGRHELAGEVLERAGWDESTLRRVTSAARVEQEYRDEVAHLRDEQEGKGPWDEPDDLGRGVLPKRPGPGDLPSAAEPDDVVVPMLGRDRDLASEPGPGEGPGDGEPVARVAVSPAVHTTDLDEGQSVRQLSEVPEELSSDSLPDGEIEGDEIESVRMGDVDPSQLPPASTPDVVATTVDSRARPPQSSTFTR